MTAGSTDGSVLTRPRLVRAAWAAAFGLLFLLPLVRVAATHRVFSQTVDEPIHLAAGFHWLAEGRYDVELEHPPLARIGFALAPYLAGARLDPSLDLNARGTELLFHSDRYRANLAAVRRGNLPWLALALVVVTVWTWRLFGRAAALIALAIFGTLPPILAHAGLATTDMAATAGIAAALLAFDVWLERRSWPSAIVFGIAVGIGLLGKFSFVVFFPIGALLLVRRMRAAQLSVAVVVSLLVVWGGYRFDRATILDARLKAFAPSSAPHIAATYTKVSGYEWVRTDLLQRYYDYGKLRGAAGVDFVDWAKAAGYSSPLAGRHGDTMRNAPPIPPPGPLDRFLEPFRAAQQWIDLHVRVPAPMFLVGAEAVARHSAGGHAAFLLGESRAGGWWYYFPVVFFFKTPLAFLALCAAGIVLLMRAGHFRIALIPMAMLLVATISGINIGVRHILPIYPFLAIAAAFAVTQLWRAGRAARIIVVMLLGWLAVATTLAHPDYLAYFNEAAGRHPERIALDSNLDWGQDLRRLVDVVRNERIERLHVAYFGSVDWRRFGIRGEQLPPWAEVEGWIAISEMMFHLGGDSHRGDEYRWLERHRPVRRVGKSIRLYYIPPRSVQP